MKIIDDVQLKLLGEAVCKLRISTGLTQEKLAEKSGLDSTYISGIERGVRNPSFKSLLRLADGLDVPISTICAEVEYEMRSVKSI